MLILGCLIVLAALFLLVKRYEARMVLVCAGIVMCLASGAPMKSIGRFRQRHGQRHDFFRLLQYGFCAGHAFHGL